MSYSNIHDKVQNDPDVALKLLADLVDHNQNLHNAMEKMEAQIEKYQMEVESNIEACQHVFQHMKWKDPIQITREGKVYRFYDNGHPADHPEEIKVFAL